MVVAAGCADSPQPAPQEVQPPSGGTRWPRFITEGPGAPTERKLGFSTRTAFEVAANQGWRQIVSVPPEASLDVALGLPCPEDGECTGVVRWQVEARREGASSDVLLSTSAPRELLQNWQTARIDLGALGGETVELSLALEEENRRPETPEEGSPPAALWAEPLWVRRPERPFYNVILISIDTLRPDRLGCYGYQRDTSPVIDNFAAEGVVFRQTISQAPWTTPSQISMLTSLYPSAHRVNQGIAAFINQRSQYRGLPDGVPTLAEVLRENGYRTVALTGGVTVSADLFSRGFDVFQEGYFYLTDWHWSRLVPVLDEIEDVPFFIFFHTFEVHAPYTRLGMVDEVLTAGEIEDLRTFVAADDITWTSLKEYLEEQGLYRKEVSSALYDSGIRHADAFMGRLFEELERRGLLDRTLIIVTSDHGEELGENDPRIFYGQHGHTVSEELIRVPLIFRLPGELQPGLEIDDPVELVDVAPTILELLKLQVPETMQGHSLVPWMREPGAMTAGWTMSESTKEGPEMKALRDGRYKYVVAFEPIGDERSGLSDEVLSESLFDLKADPDENRSLHSEEPALLQSMRQRLVEIFSTMSVPAADGKTTVVSEETLEQLRALGYVD